jgi:hypothetical protein
MPSTGCPGFSDSLHIESHSFFLLNLLGDWVDLSVDDLSVIGQFLLDAPTLDESELLDDSDQSSAGFPQQIIHIDDSYAAPSTSSALTPAAAAPPTQASDSVRLQALEAENAELKAALDQARAAQAAAQAATQAAEVERGAAAARATAEAAAAVAAQAETELAATKTKLEASEATAAAEMVRRGARADAAEALASALKQELLQCRESAEAERAWAVQEAVTSAVGTCSLARGNLLRNYYSSTHFQNRIRGSRGTN